MDAAAMAQVDAMVQAVTTPVQTAQQIDVAVLGHALDTATAQNAALLQMMRDSLDPSLGATVDLKF
jgi:hypothetical protein